MGSQLQTSSGMKLATGLLLAGTLVVAFNTAGARAKPQTVRANVHVSIGGRTDTTGKCYEKGRDCVSSPKKCCPGLVCRMVPGGSWALRYCLDPLETTATPQCGKEGDKCVDGKECCSGLVCDGLTCGPAKKEECLKWMDLCEDPLSPRTKKKCCPELTCWQHGPQWIARCLSEDQIRCRRDGEECRGGRECCSGLVCDGLTCGPAKKEECGIVGEECGELKGCCNGLMCLTTHPITGPISSCAEQPR